MSLLTLSRDPLDSARAHPDLAESTHKSLVASSYLSGSEERCEAAAAMAIGLFQMTWAKPEADPAGLQRAFDDAQIVTRDLLTSPTASRNAVDGGL